MKQIVCQSITCNLDKSILYFTLFNPVFIKGTKIKTYSGTIETETIQQIFKTEEGIIINYEDKELD